MMSVSAVATPIDRNRGDNGRLVDVRYDGNPTEYCSGASMASCHGVLRLTIKATPRSGKKNRIFGHWTLDWMLLALVS